MTDTKQDELRIAQLFHNTYERLAPDYGYETRDDTKEFDPASPNGKLMMAVCSEVVNTEVTAVLYRLENTGRSEDDFRAAIEAEKRRYE